MDKLNVLIQLLEDKRNEHAYYVQDREMNQNRQMIFKTENKNEQDERFDIVKVKKMLNSMSSDRSKKQLLLRCKVDYLQEVEDNEEAQFIKSINREFDYLNAMVDLELNSNEDTKKRY